MEKGTIQFIQTSPSDFLNGVTEIIDSRFEALKQNFEPKTPTEYLSRRETADLLKIDLSTLHRWTKEGKLISYGIGNRVYYKREEIEQSLVKLQIS